MSSHGPYYFGPSIDFNNPTWVVLIRNPAVQAAFAEAAEKMGCRVFEQDGVAFGIESDEPLTEEQQSEVKMIINARFAEMP